MSTSRRTRPSTSSSFISVKDLIKASWQTYREELKQTLNISIWLLVPALLMLGIGLLNHFVPQSTNNLLSLATLFISYAIEAWVTIRLLRFILAHTGETKLVEERPPAAPVAGYLWLFLVHKIALIGASLPIGLGMIGFFVFIIVSRLPEAAAFPLAALSVAVLGTPLWWLAVQLSFWPFTFMTNPEGSSAPFRDIGEHGKRIPSLKKAVGLLSQSYQLVNGRFWSTLIRLAIPGFVFFLLFLFVIGLVDTTLMFVVGEAKMDTIFSTIPQGYGYFLGTIGQILFLPLFLTLQALLFRSLKETRE